MALSFSVNGRDETVKSQPDTPLAYVLRNELGLKGTKIGCGLEQCGACAVLVDGAVRMSCTLPIDTLQGCKITTIEGLEHTEMGQRVQAAFVTTSAAQCGYCTSGLVVAVTALLRDKPDADRAAVKVALTPHLCRCGSHPRVLKAVEIAAAEA